MNKAALKVARYIGYSCFLWSHEALAQHQHPIDSVLAVCTTTYQHDPAYGGAPGPGRHCEAQALQAWTAELTRLVAKTPQERAAQANWAAAQTQQVAKLRAQYAIPGVGISTTGTDEIRWYLLDSTRKRIWYLTKVAKEPSFALPTD